MNNTIDLLSSRQLFDWYFTSKEFVLIDVREREDYNAGHLMLAESVPFRELEALDLPVDVPLVTFGYQHQSRMAAEIIKKKNRELEVYSVVGGIDEWTASMGNQLVVV